MSLQNIHCWPDKTYCYLCTPWMLFARSVRATMDRLLVRHLSWKDWIVTCDVAIIFPVWCRVSLKIVPHNSTCAHTRVAIYVIACDGHLSHISHHSSTSSAILDCKAYSMAWILKTFGQHEVIRQFSIYSHRIVVLEFQMCVVFYIEFGLTLIDFERSIIRLFALLCEIHVAQFNN